MTTSSGHGLFQQKRRWQRAVGYLRRRLKRRPELALFLGTGLGSMAELMRARQTIPYAQIPGFPAGTAFGQQRLVATGTIAGRGVISFEGRFHAYEGHTQEEIGFPVRVARALGAEVMLATNLAGGIRKTFRAGDFVAVADHLNLQPANPLTGPHAPWRGERFVDMSAPYDAELIRLARQAARAEHLRLPTGVYAAVLGPQLETRAEYRALRRLGADLVGMSTVPEVLVARQLGMRVLLISVVSDECDPDRLVPIDVPRILAIAQAAREPLSRLLGAVVRKL